MRAVLAVSFACLGVLVSNRSAFAQPSAPDPQRAYCHDHWLAVGGCWHRPWEGPRFSFGAEFGVAAMVEGGPFGFGNGTGSVTNPGPAWGLRAGVDFLPWLGVEARYIGAHNTGRPSVSQGGDVAFLTTGGEAVVRFVAPLRFVRPYIFGGVGMYDVSLQGSTAAQTVSTLNSSSTPGIPMGVGFDIPLTWHLTLGAEATFRFLIGESFSNAPARDIDGADLTTFTAVVKLHL
jgi:hypothetical protein